MINIYNATSTTEAHLIKGLLKQHGIDAHVSGHYLQGALGELPVIDLIQVTVDEDDEERALKVIENYEAGNYAIDDDEDS
jgi:formyltetrahydrofolate synthetase